MRNFTAFHTIKIVRVRKICIKNGRKRASLSNIAFECRILRKLKKIKNLFFFGGSSRLQSNKFQMLSTSRGWFIVFIKDEGFVCNYFKW